MFFAFFAFIYVPGIWAFLEVPADFPCAGRQAPYGLVCVCNVTYCDKIESVGSRIPAGLIFIYRSDINEARMTKYVTTFAKNASNNVDTVIHVDPRETYQKIIGYGGAFTDATGYNLVDVDERLQVHVLEAYFGKDGLEYSLGRVPIGSTDFSTREYSYDDEKDDYDLKHFALAPEDYAYKIPFIKQALELQPTLNLIGSPWSPPAWMKDNGELNHGGRLINSSQIYQTYANYLVKFFKEYHRLGVPFWGMTIQNEPVVSRFDTYPFQGLNMTAELQRDFLRDYLGPTLRQGNLTKKLKMMIFDESRLFLEDYVETVLKDPIASEFTDGIALHWYRDLFTPITVYDTTHLKYPTKFLLLTEACLGAENSSGPELGNWTRAEILAWEQIDYLNHWVSGWVDWNMVLDEQGGPNWVHNYVDANIIMNKTVGEFYKQPIFYAMGHFSKFIPADSHVISHSYNGTNDESIACAKTPEERRVCVILNREEKEINMKLVDEEIGRSFVVNIAPRSIQTILWEKK